MSSAKLGGHAAPCSSPRLALEPAAERRTWGRPSACWAGPEENMKMDGQPRKDNDEHTHTHTHFQVQGLEKGVSENEAPGPVGAYTTTHNDTITLMPNLIHRISFTELKFECRTRVAEGTSAGRSTLRHNRTHAPTGPRRARTYMRI